MPPMDQKLFNVHDAISDAIRERDEDPNRMVVGTFKITKDSMEKSSEICSRHGITLSSYLRHCCEGLIRDYYDPQIQE